LRFEYYPDTDSLYIELNPGKKRKPGGVDSFASKIVDITKLEAEGPIFGLVRVGSNEKG
jgi:uncharacterized protein YuzE